MKNIATLVLMAFVSAAVQAEPTIEQVIVRQQWPWSTDVKVEYRISGVTPENPVNLQVTAYNGGVPLDSSRLASAITGDIYGVSTDGIGEFIIDPIKAFGQDHVALANFKVKITLVAAPEMAEVMYKIFDLSAEVDPDSGKYFPVTNVTRADLLNGKYGKIERDFANLGSGFATSLDDVLIWTDATNYPAAKTDKIIFRKINAKNKTWKMGAENVNNFKDVDNAKLAHDVTLTEDYYISIYECTLGQYEKLIGGNYWGNEGRVMEAPVQKGSHDAFLEQITGKASTRMNLALNYPTEAQWEFACRAGTTAELYSGKMLNSANLSEIGWHSGNSDSALHEVGLKAPNAFGLYDMIGNVFECTLDTFATDAAGYSDGGSVTDPCNTSSGSDKVCRGGGYSLNNFYLTSPGRQRDNYVNPAQLGIRIVFPAE